MTLLEVLLLYENEYTVRRQTKKEGKDDCEVENIIKSYAVTHEDNIALISYLAHHFVSSNVVERKHFSSFADSNGPFGKPTSKKRTVLRKTLSIWKKKERHTTYRFIRFSKNQI